MTDVEQIAAGQVWEDTDPRHPGRQVRVVAIGGGRVRVALVAPRTWPNRSSSLNQDDPRRAEAGRETSVAAAAFIGPGRRRYRLVASAS